MLQFVNSDCELKSVIGDKRMAEMSFVGEVIDDVSLDELKSYHGKYPLWKRIMVAINCLRVCFVTFSDYVFWESFWIEYGVCCGMLKDVPDIWFLLMDIRLSSAVWFQILPRC